MTIRYPRAAGVCKWAARIAASLLFLFWGAFFIEHLRDWFLHSQGALPPVSVWISQSLHMAMLVGLASMLKWDRLGALVTALATAAFFASIGFHGFPYIALLNLIPVGIAGVGWYLGHKSSS